MNENKISFKRKNQIFAIVIAFTVITIGAMFISEPVVYFIDNLIVLKFDVSVSFTLLMVIDLYISFIFYFLGGLISGLLVKAKIIETGLFLAVLYVTFMIIQRYMNDYGLPLWYEIALVIDVLFGVLLGSQVAKRT